MFLSGLSLQHFRSYKNKTFLFSKPLTIILAPNASGKTNILEAIHLLSTGESFRAGKVDDFIKVGEELARIKLKSEISIDSSLQSQVTSFNTNHSNDSVQIELLLNHGIVSGKRVQKKIFSVNDVKKQRRSILGLLPTIAFIPEDLRLITGSPSRRREFLDTILMQIDANYATALTTYEQTLRRRNKLLLQIREGNAPRTVLTYWDLSLIKHGMYIQKQRIWLIEHLNLISFPLPFNIEYDSSIISEARLKQYEMQEVAVGHTLVGPHKDDIVVKFQISNNKSQKGQEEIGNATNIHGAKTTSGQTESATAQQYQISGISDTQILNSLAASRQVQDDEEFSPEVSLSAVMTPSLSTEEPTNHDAKVKAQQSTPTYDLLPTTYYPLSTHGSRGQQRMGVLWMKLGAFEVIRQKIGNTPLLLLDDIFSELDKENRVRVLELARTTQTIMTSAEEDILLMEELKEADIIRL